MYIGSYFLNQDRPFYQQKKDMLIMLVVPGILGYWLNYMSKGGYDQLAAPGANVWPCRLVSCLPV